MESSPPLGKRLEMKSFTKEGSSCFSFKILLSGEVMLIRLFRIGLDLTRGYSILNYPVNQRVHELIFCPRRKRRVRCLASLFSLARLDIGLCACKRHF